MILDSGLLLDHPVCFVNSCTSAWRPCVLARALEAVWICSVDEILWTCKMIMMLIKEMN